MLRAPMNRAGRLLMGEEICHQDNDSPIFVDMNERYRVAKRYEPISLPSQKPLHPKITNVAMYVDPLNLVTLGVKIVDKLILKDFYHAWTEMDSKNLGGRMKKIVSVSLQRVAWI